MTISGINLSLCGFPILEHFRCLQITMALQNMCEHSMIFWKWRDTKQYHMVEATFKSKVEPNNQTVSAGLLGNQDTDLVNE